MDKSISKDTKFTDNIGRKFISAQSTPTEAKGI